MRRRAKVAFRAAVSLALLAGLLAPATAASAAGAPSTSPSVPNSSWNGPPGYTNLTCATGSACVMVPNGSGQRIFRFTAYGTYSVYNWLGEGSIYNDQTDGWTISFYNASMGRLLCMDAGWASDENLTPFYYVKISNSPCS